MTYTENEGVLRLRHRKKAFQWSAIGVENFFVRGGNWKFWTLITCWGTFCGRLHRVGDRLDGKTMKNCFSALPKSLLAYIANNRRYVNFWTFFSRGMFDSRFFCHDSINSAFIRASSLPIIGLKSRWHCWSLGVVPIVAFLSLSVSLSTFKLRQSYEPWIIPSGPKNHQIWA